MDFFIGFGGWGKKHNKKGSGNFFCSQCGEDRNYQLKEVTKYAHVFFIPVYSRGTGERFIECDNCGSLFDEDAANVDPISDLWRLALALIKIASADGPLSLKQITNIRQASFGSVEGASLGPEIAQLLSEQADKQVESPDTEYTLVLSEDQQTEIEASIVDWSKREIPPFEELLRPLLSSFSLADREDLMKVALDMASSNGYLSPTTQVILGELGDMLGLKDSLDNSPLMKSASSDNIPCFEKPPNEAVDAFVIEVRDGDSFVVEIETEGELNKGTEERTIERKVEMYEVRLRWIDAPEIGQVGGEEAKQYLAGEIEGKNIWLDIQRTQQQNDGSVAIDFDNALDKYNRLLSTVYAGGYRKERNIELELVTNGLAWIHPASEGKSDYMEALDYAKRHKLGIWANKENMAPWDFRKRKKGSLK